VDAEDAGITLEEMRRRYREQIPVHRLATPEDIAGAVAFLARARGQRGDRPGSPAERRRHPHQGL